jgi:RNA-directed DNA polymerase
MVERRRKIQSSLASRAESRGDAPRAERRGTEATKAISASESPADTERLMEEVCDERNFATALKHVRANKGSPGVDGMSVDELPSFLWKHWPTLRDQLLKGTYRPQPVKRVEIPKPDGGVRKLGVPTAIDRLIQQAALSVLQKRWDRTFSPHSFGFRPKRSAHQAVVRAQKYIGEGFRWVVDLDLEKFFDRVNHDTLMGRVANRVKDKRLRKLIRAFLNAGVMENGLVGPIDEGTPQGGPLSPLLSNLVLHDLDRELERRGLRFVRYADDCNIYVRSRRAGERVMTRVTRYLSEKLKLKVNQEKSAVARPWERKFLGFSFTKAKEPKRRIAPKALMRFKERVRELTRRNRTVGIQSVVKELSRYLTGWRGYFGHCQTPSILHALDGWIRRRLRCAIWKGWKTGRRRFAELRKLGIPQFQAAIAAGAPSGLWKMARHATVHSAVPDAFFGHLGLPRLAPWPYA